MQCDTLHNYWAAYCEIDPRVIGFVILDFEGAELKKINAFLKSFGFDFYVLEEDENDIVRIEKITRGNIIVFLFKILL